jgi:hypothetical protein
LKDLKEYLGRAVTTRHFVFVIPKNRTFTCKKPSPTELADFKFFTLTMNISDGGLPATLIFHVLTDLLIDLPNDYGVDLH